MNRRMRASLLAIGGAVLMVIALLWGVLAQEKQGARRSTLGVPGGLEALRIATGTTILVRTPLVIDVPRPDPLRDGRWWMVLHGKHSCERWDGPYLTQESCVNDNADAYAQQYRHWEFECAEEVHRGEI